MSGIVINSGFILNQGVPIDSRMVATNSTNRDNILYKYAGLRVYQLDNKITYLWDGSTWSSEELGNYVSGSLSGDVSINFGSISTTSGSESNDLNFISNSSLITNKFIRTTSGSDWQGIEFRSQLNYIDGGGQLRQGSYISYNTQNNGGRYGDISFWTGNISQSERLRITSDGNIGIGKSNPSVPLDVIGSISTTGTLTSNSINSPFIQSTTISSNSLLSPSIQSTTISSSSVYSNRYFIQGTNYEILNFGQAFGLRDNGQMRFNVNAEGGRFWNNLQIDGGLNVGNGLTVSGRITNTEDATTLIPQSNTGLGEIIVSFDGTFDGPTSHALNGFTYSFNFYRVGALVHCDYTITRTGVTNYSSNFFGWLIKFNNGRFRPTSIAIGHGYGGYQTKSQLAPIYTSVFVSDPTTIGHPTASSTEFFLKINTFRGLTVNPNHQGGDFANGQNITNLSFRGSVTYIASQNQVITVNPNLPSNDILPVAQDQT